MRKKYSKQIRQKVKDSYSAIAHEFNQSRKMPWKEFNHFLTYVHQGGQILDLGCGNGRLYDFLRLKKINYLGIDNNSHLLKLARQNFPEANFKLADMIDFKLPEESLDNIFCIAAFHHLPGKSSRIKVANKLFHILKPNGVLILTVWSIFQWKYLKSILRAIGSFIIHFGSKYAWNDIWIKWGNYSKKRYYHAFLAKELLHYFPNDRWKIEEFYFSRKGKRVSFWRSFNLVLILRKI